jgi:tripartite-type tricarboxylate transporter receptor subunit TctC
VRAIALNGPSRAALYPDAPTFGEAGYPSMAFQNWIGLVAPAGVPANVLDYLNAEVTKAALFPTARAKLEQAGFRMIANKREEFISQLANDVVQWREMVRATNFRV